MTVTWTDAVVAAHTRPAPEIAVIELAPRTGGAFPAYTPGAHIDVRIDPGLIRQYSLCGPLDGGRYRLAVLCEPSSRGGSIAMHTLRVGDLVRISTPRNRFPLATARRHLLFAGGIGITPLLAMTYQLDREGHDHTLHYCVRTRGRAAFADELAGNPHIVLHVDDGGCDQPLDLDRELGEPRPDTAVYVCGPQGFIDYVLGRARARGWPQTALHQERFTTASATPSPVAGDRDGFLVRLVSTGAEYHVPGDRSILDVLLDHGVEAPYSCQQGICGECAVRAVHGILDHRDEVLTNDERATGMFTICSSRALSPVLELDL